MDQLFILAVLLEGSWEFAHCLQVFCGLEEGLWPCTLGIMWNVLWGNVVQGQCYKPSSSYMTRVRGFSIFLKGSQTHLQSVLGAERVVPIYQFCLWFLCIGFKDKGVGGCPVWGHRNCFPALCWWCGSLGFIRHWPSAHTGAVCSRMWRWDESQHLQVMNFLGVADFLFWERVAGPSEVFRYP